jgi:zinc/manganese transport system substrate-binding protein
VISVAATINVWGSVLAQLGGVHVHETSIVTNPDTDPHDYEPTPADARTVASARLLVMNGVGYDQWAAKAVAANPNSRRTVIDVGRLVGAPTGGNPHRWYDPHDVELVADAITADLKRLDPADAAYFDERRDNFNRRGWARYGQLVGELASTYAGTRVGASESIFAPLAAALHLDLVTPVTFLTAISEGAEPSAADKATTDRQIRDKQIAVYVYNSQNATPDVTAQLKEARAEGIAVVAVTETLSPASASFQDWQLAQLEALRAALRQATGR